MFLLLYKCWAVLHCIDYILKRIYYFSEYVAIYVFVTFYKLT